MIKMTKMRVRGVQIPRRELAGRFSIPRAGELSITETTDQGLHRLARIARFTYGGEHQSTDTLYDPNLLWWKDGRFVLTGFERVQNDQGQLVDFAQSWLFFLDVEPPPLPEEKR